MYGEISEKGEEVLLFLFVSFFCSGYIKEISFLLYVIVLRHKKKRNAQRVEKEKENYGFLTVG